MQAAPRYPPLLPRQSPDEVDFSNFPACASAQCLGRNTISGSSCNTQSPLLKSCYCGLGSGLECILQLRNVECWNAGEEWYTSQCPEPAVMNEVDLEADIPQCARECLVRELSMRWCTVSTRNCLCAVLLPDCGEEACLEEDREKYSSWYSKLCAFNGVVEEEPEEGGISSGSATSTSDPTALPPNNSDSAASTLPSSSPVDSEGSSGVPIGPVVGGAVGGLAVVIIASWLIYRYLISAKKSSFSSTPPPGTASNVIPRNELDATLTEKPIGPSELDGAGYGAGGALPVKPGRQDSAVSPVTPESGADWGQRRVLSSELYGSVPFIHELPNEIAEREGLVACGRNRDHDSAS